MYVLLPVLGQTARAFYSEKSYKVFSGKVIRVLMHSLAYHHLSVLLDCFFS